MRRCGSGRVAGIAQNLRGAEGRCDSVRVFCEAGVDRAFTASQRISSGWWGRVGVEGKDGGCDGKGALPGREDCGCENDVLWVLRGEAFSTVTVAASRKHSKYSFEQSCLRKRGVFSASPCKPPLRRLPREQSAARQFFRLLSIPKLCL